MKKSLLAIAVLLLTWSPVRLPAAENAPAAAVAVEEKAAISAAVPAAAPAVTPAPAPEKKAEAAPNPFRGTCWALLPAVLAILLALITKEVYSALFIGILLGGCFAVNFSPLKIVDTVINDGLIAAVKSTSGIFIFLICLGGLVTLIDKSGAAAAFGTWARNHVKSRRGAGLMTFFLGILIFIDDYFNCLTVGNVMRPITDAKGISRAKLAYIIDATAAPVCMIAPISSWAAAVSQYAEGSSYSGLELFIRAIPYNFYSLLTLIFVLILLAMKLDFGPMKKIEDSLRTGFDPSAVSPDAPATAATEEKPDGRLRDILIPVVILMVVCIFALVYNGGILDGKDFITAFSNTDATVGLPWGALLVLVITILYYRLRKVVSFQDAMECLPRGFAAMVPAILILTFATALKNMTTLLEGREFIAATIGNAAPDLAQFLPAVIFIVASFLAFSTGTSWGTFGILIPIVVSIFPGESPLLYIGMSACLAGAVCGDHCSPISDTTIMSSAGAGCDHIRHVATQLPYALSVAGVSLAGFLLAGVLRNWFLVFPATVLMLILLLCIIKFSGKKRPVLE